MVDKDPYDLLATAPDLCAKWLKFFNERAEHDGYEYLHKVLRQVNRDKYYSRQDLQKIDQILAQHLTAFRATAPSSLDATLMHFPDEFNPIPMLTSSLAHGSWSHLLFNLLFFLAFAPAIEIIIDNKLKYLSILVAISFVTSISYSLVTLIHGDDPLPTLGLSGVVMGVIGLSAYLMPRARIRVFFWLFLLIKTFYIPAWVLALWYIGWDTFDMLFSDDYGGVNLISHVSGGISGYLMGYFWLKERRDEVRDELADEIEYMRASRRPGLFNTAYSGGRRELQNRQQLKQFKKEQSEYMSRLHRLVRGNQDSEAIMLVLGDYEIQSASIEIYEELFQSVSQWGASYTQLCTGRLLINLLVERRKYIDALKVIEQCQQVSKAFVLANPLHVLLLANMARENRQYQLAWRMVHNAEQRYEQYINIQQCALLEIELLWQDLGNQQQARQRMKQLLPLAEGEFRTNLLKLAKLMTS